MLRRTFIFEKATRNTYRFAEQQEPGTSNGQGIVVGTLYVQKLQFDHQPQQLEVSIVEIVPHA